jgi:manganese/zinc/iron transport system ATP- binding protein
METNSDREPPAFECHDVSVSYDRKPVLYGIDVSVPGGSLCGIVGPNGAGKSTLIKAAMGLLPVEGGWVRMFGRPLDEVRPRVAYVPQRTSVDWDFPVNVMDVVLMGCGGKAGLWRRPTAADRELARESLEMVQMLPYADRQISQLSGGQQQRVFLARALAQRADLYFMDEPFTGVDAATERAIVTLLEGLRAKGGTIVAVHHDLTTAPEYFDRVILLNMRLVAAGPVEEVFTAELLQKTYGGRLTVLSELALRAQEARARRGV